MYSFTTDDCQNLQEVSWEEVKNHSIDTVFLVHIVQNNQVELAKRSISTSRVRRRIYEQLSFKTQVSEDNIRKGITLINSDVSIPLNQKYRFYLFPDHPDDIEWS